MKAYVKLWLILCKRGGDIARREISRAISALRAHGFRIFWISPDHKEFSFLNTHLLGSESDAAWPGANTAQS